jgi:hypothetical protein
MTVGASTAEREVESLPKMDTRVFRTNRRPRGPFCWMNRPKLLSSEA